MMRLAAAVRAVCPLAGVVLATTPALAHAGSLRVSQDPVVVPEWLVVLTGGGVIAVSFLFATLVTDHELIRAVNDRRRVLPSWGTVGSVAGRIAAWTGVAVLLAVVLSGLLGPDNAILNLAILVVWAGWWAGYTMSVYLVGNSWPALDPWRRLASLLPRLGERRYPERLGAWPAVVGLHALVWIEVTSPIAERPHLLAVVVLGYTAATLAGATLYGTDAWFREVDPIARVFRCYGRVAPVQRTEGGVEFTFPGAALAREDTTDGTGTTVIVVALLWVTTFDGLTVTPAWASVVTTVVGLGVPPLVVYLGALVAGFGLFLRVFRLASGLSRRTADSYLSPAVVESRFAPGLLPIAAGYHLAHFLGYFLSLSPALAVALVRPLGLATEPLVLSLPGWFGGLELLFVLVGHVLAVWVAHSVAFELYTGRLQPIRSQYPFIVVMIFYTMTSIWIISQPFVEPPYL